MFDFRNKVMVHFTPTLACTVGLLMLSTLNYGLENAAFSATQAMTPFTRQFGVRNSTTGAYAIETYFLSLLNSLVFIGFAVGLFGGSLVSARWGRRMTMFLMSIWAYIPAIICATAKSKEQILAGRILNYIYVGAELSVIPVFQSELVPAPVRGMTVATYQFSLLCGSIIMNSICRGTSTIPNNKAWQIPFSLFVIIPTIVASGIWFVPESPRWLLTKGRDEEALRSLQRLHGAREGYDAQAELALLKQALDNEPEQGKYRELFKGVNKKRTMIAVGVNFFLQATGQAFASSYGTIFIRSLGTVNPFSVSIGNSAINVVASMTTIFLVDRTGRRPLMLAGVTAQCVILFTMGSLGTVANPSYAIRTGIVAMLSLFNASFCFGWAPLSYVVTTEVPALRLRDKTQRIAAGTNILTNFVVAFSLPYMLNNPGNLKSKVGFVYGSVAFCAIVFAYFCIPECSGKSLEEIDEMFHAGVPVRNFGRHQSSGAGAQLTAMAHKDRDGEESSTDGKDSSVRKEVV